MKPTRPSRYAHRKPTRAMNPLTKTLLCFIAALPAVYAASLVQGDTSGNTPGTNAIDIQTARDAGQGWQAATGDTSIAFGTANSASGPRSMSLGQRNESTNDLSMSVGAFNVVDGFGLALGYFNSIYYNSDAYSFDGPSGALGTSNSVSGFSSYGIGNYNSLGSESAAVGSFNNLGNRGHVLGYSNTLSYTVDSFAVGSYNTLNANNSGVIGFNNTTYGASATVVGNSNTAYEANTTILGSGITNGTVGSMMLGPSDTAKVTILPSGFVGIGLGATMPAQMLDVAGNIRLTGNILKAGGGMLVLPGSGTLTLPSTGGTVLTNTGSQTIAGATTINGTATVVGTTTLGGLGTATQLKIDAVTGNVGIGTGTPSGKLNISGAGQVYSNFDSYVSTANYWERATLNMRRARGTAASPTNVASGDWLGDISFTPWNNGFVKNAANVIAIVDGTPGATWTPAKLAFYTSDGGSDAAERMTIKSGGSVGIGTITPGAKLSVAGSVASSQVGVHINNTATGGYSALRLGTDSVAATGTALHDFGSTHTASGNAGAYQSDQTALSSFRPNGLSLHANANAPIKFFTAGYAVANERMRIAGDGNVGIGTGATAPAAKLDVNGTVQISGDMKVKNNAVIRISAAGDIGMGSFTSGTNPN